MTLITFMRPRVNRSCLQYPLVRAPYGRGDHPNGGNKGTPCSCSNYFACHRVMALRGPSVHPTDFSGYKPSPSPVLAAEVDCGWRREKGLWSLRDSPGARWDRTGFSSCQREILRPVAMIKGRIFSHFLA